MNRLLLLSLGLFICTLVVGQKNNDVSWKDYKKQAEELILLRQYAKAAVAYEKSYELKPQRRDFLNLAAENYMLERDFANAARVYKIIADDPKYKSAKLNYAYSLKQSNQYEEAMLAFASYLETTNGKNAAKEELINKEIMGCQFALDQLDGYVVKPYEIKIDALNANINSDKSEFAPFHFSDTKLFYSSLEDGKAKIKVSEWRDGHWATGIDIKGLGGIKNRHYCNAVLTADAKEMYFTICNEEQVWGGLSSRCDIYVSTNKGKAWGQPQKLSSNINYDGATNTQPFVTTRNGQQQIYFASTRPGGQGGMDLWFATRDTLDSGIKFGEAINLGPNVNTKGNEITPFYDPQDGVIYFSSDGHITMGGFDIMKAVGSEFSWSPAENIGLPINTGADEKYYTIATDNTEGYFVSNRLYEDQKTSTTHEDIFTFNILPPHFFVEGAINNDQDMTLVKNAQVFLYELKADTEDRRLLSIKPSVGGYYNFRLLPNRNYQLGVEAEGYSPNLAYVNTNDENIYVQERNINLFATNSEVQVASTDNMIPAEVFDAPVNMATENAAIASDDIIAEESISKAEENLIISDGGVEGLVMSATREPVVDVQADDKIVVGATEGITTEIVSDIITTQNEEISLGNSEEIITKVENVFVENSSKTDEAALSAEPSISSVSSVISSSPESFISNTIIAESDNTYLANSSRKYTATDANISSNFVAKGSAKIPSGTGIYTYDDSTDEFKKEGGYDVLESTVTESTYSNPVSTYAPTVDAKPAVVYDAPASNTVMGTSYKVQLIAVEYHNPENRRYDGIKNLGFSLDTEYIPSKGWTRVLLGTFRTEEEARSMVENAQISGFKRAFVVKYLDGQRGERVR